MCQIHMFFVKRTNEDLDESDKEKATRGALVEETLSKMKSTYRGCVGAFLAFSSEFHIVTLLVFLL